MPDDDEDELIDEDAEGPEDLDEEDLEDLEDDVEDIEDDDEALGDGDDDLGDGDAADDLDDAIEEAPAKVATRDEEEDEDDDDEDSDDVEASLDVILKERLVVPDDEDEDEDEEGGDPEDRGEAPPKVLPKQPGEFVCQSCFLVKHPSQLADKERGLCRDCV